MGFGGSGLGAPGGLRSSRRICRATSFFICKSQCSSHFAAPFIVVRAEVSFAESCSLQAAMFITLRCALHRCSSRGIRRRELWHTSLRPSSLFERRYPSPRVVAHFAASFIVARAETSVAQFAAPVTIARHETSFAESCTP